MAKSKAKPSRRSKKTQEMPPESRAAQKKTNAARVRQLSKVTRLQARVAKQSAAMAGFSAKDVPETVKRDMEARRRAAAGAKRPAPARLKPSDPDATDPLLINPTGIGE